MITELRNVACRLIMRAISKGCLAGCLVHFYAGSTKCLAQQNLQIMSMLIIGHHPAGFLMLVCVPEIDSPLVALTPFWSLSYLRENSNHRPHLICTRCHAQDNPVEIEAKLMSSMSTRGRYTSLRLDTEKKHGLRGF